VHDSPGETGRRFLEETERYWQEWVRFLGIPFEWQEAVIRAAITLKLNAYDDTGAIIAAMTTSIPEAAGSQRNWDYRYCWLRDGYFVVNALNRLGATRTMERYLGYIVNVVADAGAGPLQPVFGIDGRARIDEVDIAEGLAGYRGMGPVRIGNQAYAQVQHDVYGSAVLAATHIFFDQRLTRRGDETLFHQLEALGERAAKNFDQPDAGLWELRNSAHVHTFSAVMCWAACDRLARIASASGLAARAIALARHRPSHARRDLRTRLELEAQLLHLDLRRRDRSMPACCCWPRSASSTPPIRAFSTTVAAIEHDLRRGASFSAMSMPTTSARRRTPSSSAASGMSTRWPHWSGATRRARCSKNCWRCRNRHGLLAEHIDPKSGEQWGNFVQTYSMVGLINAAIRLSIRWDQAF
jgi:GH15 family glucan-1,4-alpha-glucosidase